MTQSKLSERLFDALEATSQAGLQRAASPLQGFGVSPKHLLFFVCSPPAAARERRGKPRDTPGPRSGAAAPDNPPGRPLQAENI